MKKAFLFLVLVVCAIKSQAQFSGQGTGTKSDPYIVTNADELFEVRNDLTACYQLGADIDLTEWIKEESPQQGWMPIGNSTTMFTGSFDGNN